MVEVFSSVADDGNNGLLAEVARLIVDLASYGKERENVRYDCAIEGRIDREGGAKAKDSEGLNEGRLVVDEKGESIKGAISVIDLSLEKWAAAEGREGGAELDGEFGGGFFVPGGSDVVVISE